MRACGARQGKESKVRTLIQAFRTKELRNKILFVLGMIIIYRIGSFIPLPGVDYTVVQQCANDMTNNQENFIGLVNLFSGGAMLQLSIFALGVMPYITASIVIQLLRVVIPRFEALHKEGQSGEAKLTQYTRYLTIGLAVLQSTTIVVTANSGALFNYQCSDVIPNDTPWSLIVMVLVLTGGTGLIMWMAELITEKGIGQGMSVLIFMSICSGFLPQLWEIGWGTNGTDGDWLKFGIVVGVLLVILVFVVFVELSQRRIPVQYAKRVVGNKMYGGQNTHIPIKVNMSGVMPIIFASSILMLPTMILSFMTSTDNFWYKALSLFSVQGIFYAVIYFILIIGFAYFYATIQFNPIEMANNLRKNGGAIPGIRPGKSTSDFISKILSRITLMGALFLSVIAILPIIIGSVGGINISLGGTSVLIMVGVALDTVRNLESQMMMRHYKGFLD